MFRKLKTNRRHSPKIWDSFWIWKIVYIIILLHTWFMVRHLDSFYILIFILDFFQKKTREQNYIIYVYTLIVNVYYCKFHWRTFHSCIDIKSLVRDLDRAIPDVTRDLGVLGLIWRNALFSRLVRRAWGTEDCYSLGSPRDICQSYISICYLIFIMYVMKPTKTHGINVHRTQTLCFEYSVLISDLKWFTTAVQMRF